MIGGIDAAVFNCLIETLYETAQNTGAWECVMMLLCQHLGSDSALIRFYASDWSGVVFSATCGFDPAFEAAYRKHFVKVDPIPLAIQRRPLGSVVFLEDIVPFAELKHTEFYNDYMRPQDKRHVIGGYVHEADGAKTVFGVQRGNRRQPFGPFDQAFLKILAPHFTQALRIHQIVAEAKSHATALGRTVDRFNVATFFLDTQGRVRFANPSAESLVRSGHLLTLQRGRLRALRRDQDTTLQKLIKSVSENRATILPRTGGAIQITAPGKSSSVVTAIVTPWQRSSARGLPLGPSIKAAVFVGTQNRYVPRPEFLVGAYGLTRTEANLAVKLVETCNLEASAQAIGVTKQTARDYLKSVFRKTECHSQADLVRLILSSPGGLWTSEAAATT